MGGASLKLAGRQESFQDSRVCALISNWQVGVPPAEAQGVDVAHGFFI